MGVDPRSPAWLPGAAQWLVGNDPAYAEPLTAMVERQIQRQRSRLVASPRASLLNGTAMRSPRRLVV